MSELAAQTASGQVWELDFIVYRGYDESEKSEDYGQQLILFHSELDLSEISENSVLSSEISLLLLLILVLASPSSNKFMLYHLSLILRHGATGAR